MLVADYVEISTAISLVIIILCIAVSIILSLMKKKRVA